MKEFFYLDTGLLQSYISQIFKGLLINITETQKNSSLKSYEGKKESHESSIDGDIGFLAKLNMKITEGSLNTALKGSIKQAISDPVQNSGISNEFQSVFQKAMKDDLFNEFESYLKNESLICYNVNDFIKNAVNKPNLYFRMKATFNYVNIDRLNDMFQDEYSSIYRAQHKDKSYPDSDYFSSVRESIKLLKIMLPYSTFLCHNEYIVLINEDYLRVDKNAAGFKFNPNATILGRIRKTTLESPSANQQPKVIDALNKIQSSTFNILYKQGFISTQPKYIIDPIAVYYE